MKNFRYLIVWGLLVYCSVATKAQKITQVYIGSLRYHSAEKADLVKKEFSDMLDKVYDVQTGKMVHYIPEDKWLVITKDSVSFNITKHKKYTFLCVNKEEVKIEDYSYLGRCYRLDLQGLTVYWKTKDFEFAKRFADDIVYFQNMGHFAEVKDVKDFNTIAAQYRALKEKPLVSEEERKYIVQANAQTQLKNYKQAIELYEKAIEVDPTNPMVYNNEALLLAIVGQFDGAINSMKKYLMLVHEAVDARAAQDKIYEWEGMIQK